MGNVQKKSILIKDVCDKCLQSTGYEEEFECLH